MIHTDGKRTIANAPARTAAEFEAQVRAAAAARRKSAPRPPKSYRTIYRGR